jgi:23S rRNA-/tRNA-specific pseudouridylate synthase
MIDGHEPRAPQSIIDARTLLFQANRLLTLKDIKCVLRSRTQISGTKAELLGELGRLLGARANHTLNTEHNYANRDGHCDRQLQEMSYKRMTVKELKCELRARGAKVSGRKTELVRRLIDLDSCNDEHDDTQPHDKCREWSILEATTADFMNDVDEELPVLSSLLFVNKPVEMSCLPTRRVEGYPTFPCLSELVTEWLSAHPDGINLMQQAAYNEEMYWKHILSSAGTLNSKLLRKKTRQYEKLQTKQSSFEPRPVHRLDIDTSGIVCIALTPYALRTAGMLFERKSVLSGGADASTVDEKIYIAMVRGEMKRTDTENTVSHGIGKIWVADKQNDADGHHEWACDIYHDKSVAFNRPGDEHRSDSLQFVEGSVRDAFTSYRVLGNKAKNNGLSKCTRVELTPHTGRGHQLRLHMAALGHPIVGQSTIKLLLNYSNQH